MVQSGGYQAYLEQVVAFASVGEFEEELRVAHAQYFAATGDIREDEPSYETRMEGFTEWYVLDRPVAGQQKTPLDLFLQQRSAGLSSDELGVYQGFRRGSTGLYEFLKVRKQQLLVRDLLSRNKVSVFERRQPAGLARGILLSGRLLTFRDHTVLTRSVLYHPYEVRKLVQKELKRRRPVTVSEVHELLHLLSVARLRCDRYHRVDPERLYLQTLAETAGPRG